MIRFIALSATCLGLLASSAAADIPYYAQSPKNRSVSFEDCVLNATAPAEYQSNTQSGYYIWYADALCSQRARQITFCLQQSIRYHAWKNLACGVASTRPGVESHSYDVASEYSGPVALRSRLRTKVFAGMNVASRPIRVPLVGIQTVAPS